MRPVVSWCWATLSREWVLRTERMVPLRERITIDSVCAPFGE